MKVLIKSAFRDKDNYLVEYKPGQVVEFNDERARRIIALGYGEEQKYKPVKPKATE